MGETLDDENKPLESGAGIRILICDDEEDLRAPLARKFIRRGFEVLTAANGTEGLEICLRNDIQVVITDVRMPGGTGIELLEKLRATFKDRTPSVICMSAYSDLTLEGAYARGADALFVKPLDVPALISAVFHFHRNREERLRRFGS